MQEFQRSAPSSQGPTPSVGEFLTRVRRLIEGQLPLGWVAGEIANLTRAASGHVYFTLRDERAQIRCAMWRTRAQLLPFRLSEGMRVEVRAQATVYEARGDLQLSVEAIRQAGQGNLYETFLRLKAQLAGEGLFDSARKRALPALPRRIGLITSPAAAVLRDVRATLARLAPAIELVLYPCLVQGDAAPAQIVAALRSANQRPDGIDLLIVCRGGGSLEDLWAFNDEAVVRAIAASALPVISGVGHETDITLADFAADLRAPTPTAAAEIAAAGWVASARRLPELAHRLNRAAEHALHRRAQRLDLLQARLIHPRARLARSQQQLDHLGPRLARAIERCLARRSARLAPLTERLRAVRPGTAPGYTRLAANAHLLQQGLKRQMERKQARISTLAARLEDLSPQAVLARGYAIVRDANGTLLRDATDTAAGARIAVTLARGALQARVESAAADEK